MMRGNTASRWKRGLAAVASGLALLAGAVYWSAFPGAAELNVKLHPFMIPGETVLDIERSTYCIVFHEWSRANPALLPQHPLMNMECPPPCPLFKADFSVTNTETGEIISVMEAGGASNARYVLGKRRGHGLAGFVILKEGKYRIASKYRNEASGAPAVPLTIGEDFEPQYKHYLTVSWSLIAAGVCAVLLGIALCARAYASPLPPPMGRFTR